LVRVAEKAGDIVSSISQLSGGRDEAAEAIIAYNLGLEAKYQGDWTTSLEQNQLAAKLNPKDQATWWNLGIAATALSDWSEARRAWDKCGIPLSDTGPEISWDPCTACVRLDPAGAAEVVWGSRIDPARITVLNVPLASSNRRYGDILVHDGAQEGTRTSRGRDFPVFNELAIWRTSSYSTFEVDLFVPTKLSFEELEERCRVADLWVEDWASVRTLCAECSRGNPSEHSCTSEQGERAGMFGFAARSEQVLRQLLQDWLEVQPLAELRSVQLVVSGVSI
jgi:hypothetical protein